MNILDLQNQLKNLSQEQLIQQMQAPTGEVPQFLLLSEITRRQKMRTAFEGQQGEDGTTVAEDAIASAGVPAGFAGQMAGAMAPQTDMQGNTGAMPQAPMMPEEPAQVPGMAGGGIVALRDGGRPGSPGTFVRDGMVYITNERGEEIPWAPASEVSGLDMPAAPPAPASVRANPSFTEDRSPRSALAASREPAGPFDPMLGGVPPTMPMPLDPAMMPDVGGISSAPSVPSLMEERMGIGPAARDTPASISGEPAVSGIPGFGMDAFTAPIDLDGTMYGEATREPTINVGEMIQRGVGQVFSPMPDVSSEEFIRLQETNPELAQEILRRAQSVPPGTTRGTGITVPEDPSTLLPPAEDTVAPTDPQAVAEAEALAAAQAAAAQPGGIAGAGAGAPSGAGGIAGLAGAAGAAPTDFEQELLSMLAAREKRAEQDKWLALAQFGLQLMSSDAGTLGGAIGEAGAPALDALRSSRETAEGDRLGLLTALEQHRMGQAELALRQQAAAARSAAGSGGSEFAALPSGALTRLMDQLSEAEQTLASLPSPPSPRLFGGQRQDPNAGARAAAQNRVDQLSAILNAASGRYGVPLGGIPAASGFDHTTRQAQGE